MLVGQQNGRQENFRNSGTVVAGYSGSGGHSGVPVGQLRFSPETSDILINFVHFFLNNLSGSANKKENMLQANAQPTVQVRSFSGSRTGVIAQEVAVEEPKTMPLGAVEIEIIEMFVSVVKLLGIPKSVAEIYGLLFVTAEPLALDEIVSRLQISKGSVSQGLKLLRSFGGVKSAYVAGDRRDHYTAETELKKLVIGFMRGEVQPRMDHGEAKLQHVRSLAETLPAESKEFLTKRVGKLEQWHNKSRALLPLLSVMLDEEVAS